MQGPEQARHRRAQKLKKGAKKAKSSRHVQAEKSRQPFGQGFAQGCGTKWTDWQQRLRRLVYPLFFGLFALQALLDVFSYLLISRGYSSLLSTLLRGLLFLLVLLFGFFVENSASRRKAYLLFGGGMILFWLLHIGNALWQGAPLSALFLDGLNYLKMMQLPAFTLVFYSLLCMEQEGQLACPVEADLPSKQGSFWQRNLDFLPSASAPPSQLFDLFCQALLVGFLLILCLDGLAYLIGDPLPTYKELERGFLGWFHLANAQSILLTILYPTALYASYQNLQKAEGRRQLLAVAVFCLVLLGGGFRLFVFGTRVTFYGLLTACLALFLLLPKRLQWKSLLPQVTLLLMLVFVFLARPLSPMYQLRQADSQIAQRYQEELEADLDKTLGVHGKLEGGNGDPAVVKRVYEYYLPDLVEEFGLSAVYEEYRHSLSFWELRDVRAKKEHFAKLRLAAEPWSTDVLGLSFHKMTLPGQEGSFDLETDFPSIKLYLGAVGELLCLLFLAWAILTQLRFLRRQTLSWRPASLWRFWQTQSNWLFAGYLSSLLLFAAYVSGSVFRRPSVSIYLAFLLAYLLSLGRKEDRRSAKDVK